MKRTIMITAGGTLEAIDGVRQIKNTSSGNLGAKIANTLYNEQTDIIYVSNRYAIRPVAPHEWIETESVLDVEEKMKAILTTRKVDIVIHGMAVADYTVSGIESNNVFYSKEDLIVSKLPSSNDEIKIVCKKAPKILPQIKQWQPHTFLVGFKLLNDVTEEELFDVAFNQLRKTRCNLVIANDLTSIKAGNHTGLFIYPEKQMDKVEGKDGIADFLKEVLDKRAFAKRTKSIHVSDNVTIPANLLADMKAVGEKIFADGLLPVVEGGTYGNLSVKHNDKIYITGRNVHKGLLTPDIVCEIERVEPKNEQTLYANVHYHGKVKPSIDSVIHHMIYEKHPVLSSILHIHTNKVFLANMTIDNYVCGSKEEADAILDEMQEAPYFVQMKKHGVIIGDTSLEACYTEWLQKLQEWHLTPLTEFNDHLVWNEWLKHLEDVKAPDMDTNKKHYYAIQKGNEIYGLVWVEEQKNHLTFALYTMEEFQKQGLGIGEKVMDLLRTFKKQLILKTKAECDVVSYYKKKGFVPLTMATQGNGMSYLAIDKPSVIYLMELPSAKSYCKK